MPQPIRFLYRGAVRTVSEVSPTRTILQHIREDHHCTGTKEGCAEGDCGACTVVIGELKGNAVELKTINACIGLVPTLDGKALFTVEDLRQPNGDLHPVQQALVACHGSQCGFCTPGFVMSLWCLYLQQEDNTRRPQRKDIDDALSGNLCRCTGYRPIIDAAHHMLDLPRVGFDRKALATALKDIQRTDMLRYTKDGRSFHVPLTLEQLVTVCAAHPAATILSGSTDIGLWVTKQMRELGDIIYINQVAELQTLTEKDGKLEIGAAVSLNEAYAALCKHYPQALSELWQRFASMPIRNAGTLVGNIANGSPIGDSAPWLIALGSDIILHSKDGQRIMPLEAFYLGYQKKDLRPGEFVAAVRVPLPQADVRFRTYKLAKRFDQDISAVCAAFAITLDGEVVRNARIAFGGMAATSCRAPKTEAALNGREWNAVTLETAMQMLAQDYTPLSDMRASSRYRMKAAQNLLHRFWLETRPDAPLAVDAVNAFACR